MKTLYINSGKCLIIVLILIINASLPISVLAAGVAFVNVSTPSQAIVAGTQFSVNVVI